MKRDDFQRLAVTRLADAEVLFAAERFDACYYLVGYAVECALKACIARQTEQYDFPDKIKTNKIYTHNLEILLAVSGLEGKLAENQDFGPKWNIVKDWSEESRYQHYQREPAERILQAVSSSPNGVLRCLQAYW